MKKILKSLLTILMLFVFTTALIGCENEETGNSEDPSADTTEGHIDLYSDENKIVFNYSDIYYITYYHEGEQITGLEYVYKYEDEATARIAKTMLDNTYEEEENLKDIVVQGRYIIITFTEGAYDDETLESVRATYSFLEEVYNEN